MNLQVIHDHLKASFDPTLPEFDQLAGSIKSDFSDLVETIRKSGPTFGNKYEEAIAEALAGETQPLPALGSEDVVEVVTPAETETTDAGSDETENTPKRRRK